MDDGPGPLRSGPTTAEPPDAPGSARHWRPSWGYLALGLAILAGGLALAFARKSAPAPAGVVATAPLATAGPAAASMATAPPPPVAHGASSVVATPPAPFAASAPRAAMAPQIPRLRDPGGDLTPDVADFVNPGERPTMNEVIERLHQAGVRGGLGAFSPPGTRPPRIGLAVPDDFVLPEGYVRHHQATDDGQRIEPILMFSPDHAFFDAAGRPVEVPTDRVVPPELAPPGLPLRRIVIPAATDSGRPGR